MRTLAKYLALQVPGWLGLGIVLYLAMRFWELSLWNAAILFGALLVKDAVQYPFVRHAYSDAPSRFGDPEALVGVEGVAEDELAPRGWVRVRGERWKARVAAQASSIAPGDRVVVRSVQGLEVQVEAIGVQETDDT